MSAAQPNGGSAEHWPACPGCDERRMTVCPYCQTAGQDFSFADREFSVVEVDEDGGQSEGKATGCDGGCGSGCQHQGSGSGQDADDGDQSLAAVDATDDVAEDDIPLMVMCPTCDEPFAPRYLRRCEWCGHTFPDGVELDVEPSQAGRPDEPSDPLTPQAIVTIIALLALGAALLIWFLLAK